MRLWTLTAAALTLWVAMAPVDACGDVVTRGDIEAALIEPAIRTRAIGVRPKPPRIALRVAFALDSAELDPNASTQLIELVSALNGEPLRGFRFRITGHTDSSGPAGYNLTLSQDRAETVEQFLVVAGVDSTRLEVIGRGEEEPLLPDTPAHPDNRRVEITNIGAAIP